MSLVKRNIAANYIGKTWKAIISLAFIPIYIKFMGMEAYGLVGFFVSLQAISNIMDMGLSKTINKELAALSTDLSNNAQQMGDFVRTLEFIYWGIAFALGLTIFSLSELISHEWLNSEKLSPDEIQQSVIIMGLVMAIQWPISLYSGGLMGMQKHVLLNGINIFSSTFKSVGAVIVLWIVSPTIQVFFLWQAFASLIGVIIVYLYLWKSLPKRRLRPTFSKDIVHKVWKFTAGVTGITITAVLLTQIDKIILSKILTLEAFGYYILAVAVANSLYSITQPIHSSVFPRYTQLVSTCDKKSLIDLYHKSCQLVSVLLLPIALIISFFSKEIMYLWTGDIFIAENTHILVSILVIGTMFNGLISLPYALQLAHGVTRLALRVNTVAVVVLIPLVYFLANDFGAIGASIAWAVLNLGYFFVVIHMMHSFILKGEKMKWYIDDVLKPALSSLVMVTIWSVIIPEKATGLELLLYLFIALASTLLATFLSVPYFLDRLKQKRLFRLP
jgi:O-antigen/teichoic acid export membrane protein